jgi:hypothetical protein
MLAANYSMFSDGKIERMSDNKQAGVRVEETGLVDIVDDVVDVTGDDEKNGL